MKTLRETLRSLQNSQALLHYNIATYEQYKAAIVAVTETGLPMLIGVSEGERGYVGTTMAGQWVKEAQKNNLPIFINADHCKSEGKAIEALDARYDEVLMDGTEFQEDENILRTKNVIIKRNELQKKDGIDTLIEGEIGYLAGSSDLGGSVEIKPEYLTTPEQAIRFVQETDVELLAISVGNVHGIPQTITHNGNVLESPQIDFNRIKAIYDSLRQNNLNTGLVLHGGSGLTDDDFIHAIECGIQIIHLNTEFRAIWKDSLKKNLEKDTVNPYKILNGVVGDLKTRIVHYQRLFYTLQK